MCLVAQLFMLNKVRKTGYWWQETATSFRHVPSTVREADQRADVLSYFDCMSLANKKEHLSETRPTGSGTCQSILI